MAKSKSDLALDYADRTSGLAIAGDRGVEVAELKPATIYIKPMTWAGQLEFYVGLQPSRPDADPCNRLGSYFIRTERLFSAQCIATAEAQRMTKAGRPTTVVECAHYVGYERSAVAKARAA